MLSENPAREPSASVEGYILQEWKFGDLDDPEVKELCSTIREWAKPGNWLDLGCGPLLAVWPTFLDGTSAISGCDRHDEVREFYRRIEAEEIPLPAGFLKALEYYNFHFSPARRELPIKSISEIVIGDVTQFREHWRLKYDTVVQIGCFGCLNSIHDLKIALNNVREYLKPGGIFISETWVPMDSHVDSDAWGGNELRSLSVEQFSVFIEEAGLAIKSRTRTPMSVRYSERFILVAERP